MGRKKSRRALRASKQVKSSEASDCHEGKRLDDLLTKIRKSIELANLSKGELPHQIWIKQHFAVGVNDVTRVLERMPPGDSQVDSTLECSSSSDRVRRRAPLVPLQVTFNYLKTQKIFIFKM
ncbi:hypothetical protein AXF42_Ash021305 [Apostasia shenzhenica]|uniref:Uncharacterized protein n=1 Tax=Apostasia shenzhenica TaxID=1088818 RepID=A0A2I0AD63_9ASPA|nr:hypothetical protein AXF42_Ash021305 [Apostasia shenzhenica]